MNNFCLSSGLKHFSLGISLSCLFVTVSKLLSSEVLDTFIILPVILLPIKSPVASAVFWITYFEAVLSASVADSVAWLSSLWLYSPLNFLLMFLPIFLSIFLAKDKNP